MQLWMSSSFERRSPFASADGRSVPAMSFDRISAGSLASLLPARDDVAQIVFELRNGADAGIELLAAEHRLERAEDGERPAAQRLALALRNAEHVADELDWNGGGKIRNQIDLAAFGGGLQQAIDQNLDPRLQFAQRPRRESGRQQLAHPRVIRRVVEHQARGVMLVEQAVGKIRPEVEFLVRAPGRGIAVDRKTVVVARQEIRPVRHQVNGIELAQRAVCRIGIFEKFRREFPHVEISRGSARGGVRGLHITHDETPPIAAISL